MRRSRAPWFVFALVLTATLAGAAPGSAAPRARASASEIREVLRLSFPSWVTLWEKIGLRMDPDGQPQGGRHIGLVIDPNGQPADSRKIGLSADPDGQPQAQQPGQEEADLGISVDPDGVK